MRIDLTVCGPDGAERDVAVLADAPVPFRALRAALDPAGPNVVWCSGARPVSYDDVLGGPGLRSGDRLAVAPQTAEPAVRGVNVVGGIDAGLSLRGARRSVVIGRSTDCDLRLRDPDVSRRHVELRFGPAGVLVRDLASTHGTTVGTDPVTGPTRWEPPDLLRVGDTHLARSGPRPGPAVLRPDTGGWLVVGARQRAYPPAPPIIELPPAGSRPMRTATGWSAILVPSVAGVGMALWTGSLAFLALAVLSPLLLAGVFVGERAAARRRNRRAQAAERAGPASVGEQISAAVRNEVATLRSAHPDAATVLAIARGPLDRLWERRRGDPDVLQVRLGLTDLPSAALVSEGGRTRSAAILPAVPALLDLAAGPVGLVGPRNTTQGLARWLIGQLAVNLAPTELRIAVRTANPAPWHWMRWLPHVHRTGSAASTLVVLDDPTRGGEPIETPAICLAETVAELPASCTQLVTVTNEAGTRLRTESHTVLTDAVGQPWAEQLARALAPLVPAADGESSALPDACGLQDVLGDPDPEHIARGWNAGSGKATAAIGLDGAAPVVLDLDRHGPHLLVAGTTGSGKSELLRTLVVSLACSAPPDEISFVLIDYKGGSAFADCAELPHVTGMVTDLDEHLTGRALASLRAELRRRERLFASARAADLAGYRASAPGARLPRLVIVVDEFATLAAELPDFVARLTSVAQRGRSLGLHLVLATQRPAGVVTAEVRANCAMRIALRVTDPADSRDVLEVPDAAAIPHRLPGRAYVWVDGTVRAVQVARTDLPVSSRNHVEVVPLGPWRTLGEGAVRSGEGSQLKAYVAAIRAAAAGRNDPPPAPPWLPPLADRIRLTDLPELSGASVAIGTVDRPERQLQQPLVLDLDAGCSVLLAGAPRSGRTAGLVTIAAAAARRYRPDALHVYALDFAGDLVERLGALPHAGTLAGPADGRELAEPLLRELARDESGVRILLLVDGWEVLARSSEETDSGRTVERLLSLIRAGSRGRTIAVAGDRSALVPRLAGAVTTRLLLRMPDRTDYALAGIPLAAVPATLVPGRALLAPDGTETQLAYVEATEPAVPSEQVAAGAVRLRPLPARLRLGDLPPPTEVAPFAVAAPFGHPVGIPLNSGPRLLIAEPPRSGRSTALVTLAAQAARAGVPATVIASAGSPLRGAAARLGLAAVSGDAETVATLRTAVFVDDAADLADTPLDDALVRWARSATEHALVVSARTDEAARCYRGLVAEVRRSRCALLLQPSGPDGDLLGLRLESARTGGPPGRGVLLGDPAWGPAYAAGLLRVQVAMTEDAAA